MNAARCYAQAQNETASPERLMALLFETALRHMRTGAAALEAGHAAEANIPLTKATDIVVALHSTFDATRCPELGDTVGAVYRFVCERLIRGNLRHEAPLIREAERVFLPVAEAFIAAAKQVTGTRTP